MPARPDWYSATAASLLDRVLAAHPIWRAAWRTILGRIVIESVCVAAGPRRAAR